jgi:hypothetical protein
MNQSNKSNITTVTPGKNQAITWGSKSSMNFSGENTINAAGSFSSSVGGVANFAGGSRLLWSFADNHQYELKDGYRYHFKGNTSFGRNTAMKHQNYFYVTAGFDPNMLNKVEKFSKSVDVLAKRTQITNAVLMVMSLTYKFMGYFDQANEKVIKAPNWSWTEQVRELLERGTSGVVYALSNLKTLSSAGDFIGSLTSQKDFPRSDFQPHALAQVSKTKGVFLGTQYENAAKDGERTTAALYLDNMIRLRATSTAAENASQVFYPRDIQAQSNWSFSDWLSPGKIATRLRTKNGKEPIEYAEFNGFKAPGDSTLDIGPASIESCSSAITSHALNHLQRSITTAELEYKIAQAFEDEIKTKLDIAEKQVLAIKMGNEEEGLDPILTPAQMAMAPLAAAAKAADEIQKAVLLAEAMLLLKKLTSESDKAEAFAQQKKTLADTSKSFSELKTSADFFEISHESGENKVGIKGSSEGLNFETNQTKISVTDKDISLMVGNSAALAMSSETGGMLVGSNGIYIDDNSTSLMGGGSEIKLANGSVTIGDLKIMQVEQNTRLNLLDQSDEKMRDLASRFETLERSFDKAIAEKDEELKKLKEQVAKLGDSSKSRNKLEPDQFDAS